MKLKILGRQITIGKDIGQYAGTSDDWFSVMMQKYGSDYTSKNKLEAYRNIVYACVNLIGEQCGKYEPIVQRKNGDQWETIDHEFMNLLRRPGGRDLTAASFSQFDLFEATGSFQELQGDCFWYMALGKTTKRPRQIVLLRPDKVGTDIDRDTGNINGYFIRQPNGVPIPLDVNEVLRFPLFNPKTPYKGMGRVEAGSDYISTDEATAQFTKNFFANNAGISGVLNIKGEVTKGAFRKFVRAWRDKYQGVSNAGKVAILRDSDADFTKVGLGLDELSMPELRKMTLEDVLMIFRVPLPLLGKAEQTGLGRANVEALEYIFAKYNIDTKFRRFDSVLQFALERYYGQSDSLRITHKSIIPEDKEYELAERIAGIDKWIKRNEARDEEGLDPVDGGDQLFVPLNEVPINEASLNTPIAPSTSGIKVKITRKVVSSTTKDNTSQGERFRITLMRNQMKYERQYRKTVKPIFQQQRTEALRNLEAHGSGIKKESNQTLFDGSVYDALMVQELTPMLTDLTTTQGGLALIFAGDTKNEFKLNSRVLDKIRQSTAKMSAGFNDETLSRLNKTLAEGIQNGEGIGSLKGRVNEVYDNIDNVRAERIARTETLKASNRATLDAYKQTGYVTGMKWADNPGACEICQELAQEDAISLDDTFRQLGSSVDYTDANGDPQSYAVDYEPIDTPPVHPNCRCTIIPISE